MEASTSTGRLTYVSGRWVPENQASIHIYDSQFMFGDGVFEMHRTFKHVPFLFEKHMERLFASMRAFQIPIDKTAEDVGHICDESMRLNAEHFKDDEYRFMINVSRGPLPIYREVFELQEGEEWGKPTWIVNAWPLSKTARTLAHLYDTGINAVLVPQRQIPTQFLDPKVKSRSRAHLALANLQASIFGRDALALLLDDDGFITEGTGANFMLVKDGDLIIPERRNMLRGCSMQYIIDEIAPEICVEVIEKNIEPYDVMEADEAFFTGTFTNLIPCNRFNGVPLKGMQGSSDPMGDITSQICACWSDHVGLDFIQQVREWAKR